MRRSETLCYIKLNGNRDALETALEQRKGCEDSCVSWYVINDTKQRAEITILGYRGDLARELERLGISRGEIELC